jgi:hypothetical protein
MERLRSSSPVAVHDGSNASQGAAGKYDSMCSFLVLIVLTDTMRISDLESLYPGFRSIYQKHVQNARFEIVLTSDSRFESLKLRLITVRYLLEKYQCFGLEGREKLIRTTLLEGNFREAQQMIPKTDEKPPDTSAGGVDSSVSGSGGSGDSLEKEMRNLAAKVPASEFLSTIKGVEDDDLRPMIKELETIAHEKLASSIDETVEAMARTVFRMQQEYCERSMRHEKESEERESQNQARMRFIQDINAQSVGRRDS